ncbi:glycosyltransferase [Flavobacteriaceae bacterium MHTCC 0001]
MEKRAYILAQIKDYKMIPKKIHYCWFGGGEKTAFIKKCISTWEKYLPDYDIICWSEENFDVNSNQFVKQAYLQKKWAFVSDYARLYALGKEGGIYMDTDVKLLKAIEENWLSYDFFSSIEYLPDMYNEHKHLLDSNFQLINTNERFHGLGILSAFMASVPNHKYILDCIKMYDTIEFETGNNVVDFNDFVIGSYITKCAEKYGFIYQDKAQTLKENMLILEKNVLVGNTMFLDENSHALHLVNGSWIENRTAVESFLHNVKNNFPRLSPIVTLVHKLYMKIKK